MHLIQLWSAQDSCNHTATSSWRKNAEITINGAFQDVNWMFAKQEEPFTYECSYTYTYDIFSYQPSGA